MSKTKGPWDDARRAFERLDRLAAWLHGHASSDGDVGAHALDALSDIGVLRRHLDQAELIAVRAARRQKKSWAEIATRLGVTRQSAWERWRDVDDEAEEPAASAIAELAADVEPSRSASLLSRAASHVADDVASTRRRRSLVTVPNVVGLTVDAAVSSLRKKGLRAMNADPDGAPLETVAWRDSFVSGQAPEAGARVAAEFAVRLWLGRRGGGSAGVREPRRPGPSPLSAREMRAEPADEAVG